MFICSSFLEQPLRFLCIIILTGWINFNCFLYCFCIPFLVRKGKKVQVVIFFLIKWWGVLLLKHVLHFDTSMLGARLVCHLKTQCSVFKHWTLVFKNKKNMFGVPVLSLLFEKHCSKTNVIKPIFWNQLRIVFKQ